MTQDTAKPLAFIYDRHATPTKSIMLLKFPH